MMSKRLAGNIAKLSAACAFSALIIASSQARADDSTSALLDLLKAKGDITQAEYDKIKARQQAEAKDGAQKVQAAEARAREAEAKAKEAEAKANEAQAKAQTDSPDVARVKAQTLTAADMPMPAKAPPVAYVTALKNCVGVRIGEVDVCFKGDLVFFGIENFPDKGGTLFVGPTTATNVSVNGFTFNPHAPTANKVPISGGFASLAQTDANSTGAGLLPSSISVAMNTNQNGIDIGFTASLYTGGSDLNQGSLFNANGNAPGGIPIALGTPGIDFRQVFGTLGTPTWGTVKVGRDLGLFGSDAILNDLTLFGVGTPGGISSWAPGNTTNGRIGIGYIYADWIPQITYKSPSFGGFTFTGGVFTPLDQVSIFSTDATTATAHNAPMLQGQIKYVGDWGPATKLTLSADAVWEHQICDVTEATQSFTSSCVTVPTTFEGLPLVQQGQGFNPWAVDGFAMLDVYGFNFVAYGYTGRGVGSAGLFLDGIDIFGDLRQSYGGYGQVAYTFAGTPFTIGGSWGESVLKTANEVDTLLNPLLARTNESWVGFARYKLTKWVLLQAEYTHTRSTDQIGSPAIASDAIAVGTDFFW
jgi:predicted porin